MSRREIVIHIRLPEITGRALAFLVVLALLVGAVAYAGVMWTPFVQGEKLTSAKLNANFKALGDAIDKLQAQPVLPRIVQDNNNTELAIYVSDKYLYLPALKGPWAGQLDEIRFTQANCMGTPYAYAGLPIGYSNGGFNTSLGNIYQAAGAAQILVGLSIWYQGKCMNYNPILDQGAIPIKDTGIPNFVMPNTGVSLQIR